MTTNIQTRKITQTEFQMELMNTGIEISLLIDQLGDANTNERAAYRLAQIREEDYANYLIGVHDHWNMIAYLR